MRKLGRPTRTRAQVIDHLAENFEVDDNGCWVWTGRLQSEGYAAMTWKQDGIYHIPGGHRVVLHAIGQPVPRDKVVDHLCRNRACINPDHLEVVVQRENILRSPIAPGALNAAKTHCANNHPYSEENTYVYTFKRGRKTTVRVCRTCRRASRERRRAARMGAVA